jgi:hypothetical protein
MRPTAVVLVAGLLWLCSSFSQKNSDGTWTSGPDTKIGANAFPNHTFGTNGVSIGGVDLATALNQKCGG